LRFLFWVVRFWGFNFNVNRPTRGGRGRHNGDAAEDGMRDAWESRASGDCCGARGGPMAARHAHIRPCQGICCIFIQNERKEEPRNGIDRGSRSEAKPQPKIWNRRKLRKRRSQKNPRRNARTRNSSAVARMARIKKEIWPRYLGSYGMDGMLDMALSRVG
jgi:hypothetical protein